MLSWEQIDQLERFDGGGAPVLSVYLDLEPASQVKRSYRVELKDLVKEAAGRLTEPERKDLAREAGRVNDPFDRTGELRGRGLIIFSRGPRDLWLAYLVPVAVRNHLALRLVRRYTCEHRAGAGGTRTDRRGDVR
jgi:hypothetical protein